MQTAPLPKNEADRLDALHSYRILDTLPEREFDRFTELASIICNVPISLISLIDENRQWFKSKVGLAITETSRDIAFCQYTLLQKHIMEVEDASRDERFKDNVFVTTDPHIRFYAGYPLIDPNGHALGSLCVIDSIPKKLTTEQKRALQILGESVMARIMEQRQSEELKHFEQLFKLSNNLICIAGTDGTIKKLNPAFKRILGWNVQNLLNTSFFDLVHPEDIDTTKQHLKQINTANPTASFMHRFRNQAGEYRNLQWVATPEPLTGYLFAIGRDITDERKREQQLYDSENRFRSFFESSQGLMCTHDIYGKLLTVNTAGAAILGYSPEELVGRSLFDVVAAEYHEALHAYLQTIIHIGKATGIMHTRHKNGEILIWLFNNTLVEDLTGEKYVVGNAIDITARQKLEDDLKHTKEMLERTNEVARIGTWEINNVTQEIYWSEVTRNIYEVPEGFEPDFENGLLFFKGKNKDLIIEAVTQAIEHGTSYDIELQIVTTHEKELWVRSIGTPEFEDGICKRLYGTLQDINERKQAEQDIINEKLRLAAFVAHAPAAVAMLDKDMHYIAYSKRWLEDYHLEKEVIGLSHYEVFPNVSKEWKAIHARTLNGFVEKNEEDVWRPEGWSHDQYLRWEVRPWYQFDGSIGGMMMFTQDITEICIQRDELKKAKVLAEQANIAKSEFLANMSHEIRTPLNGVIGFTDLVLKTNLDDTQKEYLSIVNQSGNALLSIINDILDFSKIEAGKLELDIHKADLPEICTQATAIILYQAKSKGLIIEMNIAPELPRFVWIDATRLKQVLINLLSNAVKFTETGTITLNVFPRGNNATENIDFRFEVKDTGIGIQPQKQGIIFEAFSQEDPSTTKKYGGTGLGLTISNKLLDLMGSRLQLKSKPGEGSCFYFDLHLKTSSEPIIQTPAIQQTIPREASKTKSIKVLIVEDNIVNKLLSRTIIKKTMADAVVTEASNGIEAVQLYQQTKPDIILMDIQMPEMNGYEATKKIRELGGQIPIIALTAGNMKGEREKCVAAGMSDFLTKPVVEESLTPILKKWLTENKTLQHFDLETVKNYVADVDDDPEAVKEILTIAITELNQALTTFELHVNNKDLSGLNAAGHKLYGTAITLGMKELGEIAHEFEFMKTFDDTVADQLMNKLRPEIKLVLELMNLSL